MKKILYEMKKILYLVSVGTVFVGQPCAGQEVSLVVDITDRAVMNDISGHFKSHSKLQDGLTIKADQKRDLTVYSGPLVYMYSANQPDTDRLNAILESLKIRNDRATVMFFFESADRYDWVSQIDKPDNLKLTISVRSFDAENVAHAYSDMNLSYNGSGLRYDYGRAAEAALAQIDTTRQKLADYALKAWSPDVAALSIFDPIGIISGAPNELRRQFLDTARARVGLTTLAPPDNGAVHIWSTFGKMTTDDMIAVGRAIAGAECERDWKWHGMTKAGMSFQALGQ